MTKLKLFIVLSPNCLMFDLILNQLSVTFSACHLNFVALAGLGNQVYHQLWMEEFGGNRNSSTENETDK